jgi:HEAT repeat protein
MLGKKENSSSAQDHHPMLRRTVASRHRRRRRRRVLPAHQPQDALERLHVAGDPESPLVLEPELLLRLLQELLERPVAQVLRGDHEPLHLLADAHREEPLRDTVAAAAAAALAGFRRERNLLPLLEKLSQPHDVSDPVAAWPALLPHCQSTQLPSSASAFCSSLLCQYIGIGGWSAGVLDQCLSMD